MAKDTKSFLKRLKKKRRKWLKATRENEFEDGIRSLLSDLYPDQAHFIFELLQNAEDAQASRVQFQITNDNLIVRHDGSKLFNKKDVKSITSIGASTKKEKVNKIGKFGIGFKAVFAYSDTPQVHSGEYNFEIQDLICPEEIPGISKHNQETVFVFPFNNKEKRPESCFSEIKDVFESLDHTVLLFLNNIESIEWNLNGEASGSVVREHLTKVDERLIKISVTDSLNERPQKNVWFLRFEKILKKHGTLKCSIALELDFRKENESDLEYGKDLSEQMKVVPVDAGKLCVFFPAAKETTGLKVHVNGPYAATIDRASIPHDREENRAIFKSTAELFVEAVEYLKKSDMLTSEFLGVLPNNEDQLFPFYAILREIIHSALSERELIPCLDGGYGKAEALARGPKTVNEVIGDDALAILFGGDRMRWAARVMQNSRSDKLLESLGIPSFGYEKLISAVNEKFAVNQNFNYWQQPDDDALRWLQEQHDKWLQSFYILLLSVAKQRSKERQISKWKIVKTRDGDISVGGEIYFPFGDSDLVTELPTVVAGIFQGLNEERQERLQEFLVAAGVRQKGEREELQHVLDHFYTKDSKKPEDKDHIEHVRRFIGWSRENGTELFGDYFIFKNSTEKYFCRSKVCYIDAPIENSGLNSIYFDKSVLNKSRYALWDGYTKLDGFVQFAEKCGVQRKLEIESRDVSQNPKRAELYRDTRGSRRTIYEVDEDYYIESLEKLLDSNSVEVSRLVWRTLTRADSDVLTAKYRPSGSYPIRYVDSSLVQTLQSSRWVPGSDNKFYLPREISRKSLRDDFPPDNRNGWLTAIGFAEDEEKVIEKNLEREKMVKKLGFTPENFKLFESVNKSPKLLDEVKQLVEKSSTPIKFPVDEPNSPEKRIFKMRMRSRVAPEKRYVKVRRRLVREEVKTDLEIKYSNDDGQLICQICETEMPFRLLNDDRYYFEAVQLFNDLKKDYDGAYLALCPLCAAKFKELVRRDKKQCQHLRDSILNSEELRLELKLGDESGSIRFVQKHYLDIQVFLAEENEQLDVE